MCVQLEARDLMKIASNQGFVENDDMQNKEPASHNIRKVGNYAYLFSRLSAK